MNTQRASLQLNFKHTLNSNHKKEQNCHEVKQNKYFFKKGFENIKKQGL